MWAAVFGQLYTWILLFVVALHGLAAWWFSGVKTEPPKPLPSRPGRATIRLRPSLAMRPRQIGASAAGETAVLMDLPPLTDLPKIAPPRPVPVANLDRPRAIMRSKELASGPLLKPKTTAPLLPDLDDLPEPAPPASQAAPAPRKPGSTPRPQLLKRTGPRGAPAPPELKAVTAVGELAALPSPGSEGSEGAQVDSLPMKKGGAVNPPPPYPDEALQARQEGTVLLRVKINAAGRVDAIRVSKSSGVQSLDDSALTTVRRWVFEPARRGGVAVSSEVIVPVRFRYVPR